MDGVAEAVAVLGWCEGVLVAGMGGAEGCVAESEDGAEDDFCGECDEQQCAGCDGECASAHRVLFAGFDVVFAVVVVEA